MCALEESQQLKEITMIQPRIEPIRPDLSDLVLNLNHTRMIVTDIEAISKPLNHEISNKSDKGM